MNEKIIVDGQSLKSVANRYGRKLPTYDNGFGPLFIYRDSMGIGGVVRARSWEDAFEIVADEFLPVVSDAEELAEIEAHATAHDGELPEGYRYQGSFTGSGIVSYDLNGEYLDELTPELIQHLELTLEITDDE